MSLAPAPAPAPATVPDSTSAAARRAISRQARDAFPPMGIWAIRTGERVLVSSSRNVVGAINRARFELRLGSHTDRALQAEWRRRGDSFVFEVLALVKQREDPAFDYASELRELEQLYRDELAATGAAP
ncbi:GIY-YIG nuclease family protein [Ramlibacter sp. AN1015]|uniref:GIY-YIG nuclease family protein n=1 Tax=Ramlibacter sp. AN1015 TaxID=3133428 RepID=UPI0030BD7412